MIELTQEQVAALEAQRDQPWQVVHPPSLVWGPLLGSAARFQSSTLRLQFRVAAITTSLIAAAMGKGSLGPLEMDCSVIYRFLLGYAVCTSVIAEAVPL